VTSIPIIDFAGVRAGDAKRIRAVAGEVFAACTGVGFFYIKNHGVPEKVVERAMAAARDFFHLPAARKAEVSANANHRGFHALGDALMYGAKKPDYKEFYSIGLEPARSYAVRITGRHSCRSCNPRSTTISRRTAPVGGIC
jgi:isopenicillin N synthase-like dioxygenase